MIKYKALPRMQSNPYPVTIPLLSQDQCKQILSSLKPDWDDGQVVSGEFNNGKNSHVVSDIRKVKTQIYDNKEALGFILTQIQKLNMSSFMFDIDGILEFDEPTIMRYDAVPGEPEQGGHYNWHLDIGDDVMSTRKISFSILLSHPSEYDGGELEFTPTYPVERQQGAMTIFPSFLCHRVAPVKRGSRYALVGWVHGDHFK